MVNDCVDHAHGARLLGRVVAPQEKDLPGTLLPNLTGQVGRSEPSVEARHVGIGLFEHSMLTAGKGQVADHVEAVPTAYRPPGDNGDHDLGHEPDQALYLEDVQSSCTGRIDHTIVIRVPVAVNSTDALVAT